MKFEFLKRGAYQNCVVVYHKNCPDGFGAALSAKRGLEAYGIEVTYRSFSYGEDTSGRIPEGNNPIFFLDYVPGKDVLLELAKRRAVIVIDHHKTAFEELSSLVGEKSAEDLDGTPGLYAFIDKSKSGAMLAWRYFVSDTPPTFIQYIEDRDLWRHVLPDSKPFNAYVASLPFDFSTWEKEIGTDEIPFDEIVLKGKTLIHQNEIFVSEICQASRLLTFEGNLVPVANAVAMLRSDVGNRLLDIHKEAPFSVVWYWDGNDFRVSLRARVNGGVDVEKIAVKYEGGGHRTAAAFKTKNIIPLFLELAPLAGCKE